MDRELHQIKNTLKSISGDHMEKVDLFPGIVLYFFTIKEPGFSMHHPELSHASWFSHLAIEVPGENGSNEWLEPVSDNEYSKLK